MIESDYKLSLATSWSTAFESLSEEPAGILGVIAHIATDLIPNALFKPQSLVPLPDKLLYCEEWT